MTPHASRRRWRTTDTRTAVVLSAALFVSLVFAKMYAGFIWTAYSHQLPGHPPLYGDFFALWSYPRVASAQGVGVLYDPVALHTAQVALGMDPARDYPFPYPPMAVLLLWPLGWLPFNLAYALTMAVTLSLFVLAIAWTCTRAPLLLAASVLAPVTTATIFVGQLGFLYAALMTAGIRLAGSRPLTAGFLLGLLSYKPQFGFLVPVALAAAGRGRVIAAAAMTMLALALVATLILGPGVWSDWLTMLPAYAQGFDAKVVNLRAKPTVMANLQLLGVALPWARAVQWLVTAAVVAAIWRVFRKGSSPLAAAALLVGTMLAAPHAFYYDLPMILPGMALFIETRRQANTGFTGLEITALTLAYLFPVVMLLRGPGVFGSAVCLALLFWVIVRAEPAARDAAP